MLESGICVVSGNAVLPRLIAENVLYAMLIGLKRWHESNVAMKAGVSRRGEEAHFASSLFEKKVGIVGYIQIAREVIRPLRPFAPQRFVSDPFVEAGTAKSDFTLCSTDEICKNCDIISMHHTLTDDTYHMIDQNRLAMMQDGALLINMARGGIIDETALENELCRGRIYALLDVFETELLASDSRLRKLDNVFITPHLDAYSRECYSGLAAAVVEQVEVFVAGGTPSGKITTEIYDRMTDETITRRRR